MNLLPRLLAAALAGAALVSCAQTAPTPPEPEAQRLSRELRTLIGPATCSADSQCRTVPVGAKACGGPSGYLAWSTTGTDAQRLTDLAARQAEASKQDNATRGMVSTCSMVTDPGAACVAGRCQLNANSAATAR
jgi:hypothetical protein